MIGSGGIAPSAIPANGSLEYTFIGSGPTVTHMPGSGLRVTRQGTDYLLEVGFETVSSVTLDAYLDGVPVYHATQHTGTDWIWVPIALYILAHTDAHVEWKTGDGCSGGVSWNGPTAIQIPAGPMITCDLLVARPENSTLVFDSVEAVQIKGANLAPFTLTEERVGVLDHSVTALGQAALMPVGGNLMVSNLGSSGQDGVAIHPRVLAGRTLDGISIALAALDPGGQAPLGATFTGPPWGCSAPPPLGTK